MELSQLCAANYHYKRYTLDYFLESAERLGYQSIELWASGPHLHLEDFDAARLAELNRKIKHIILLCAALRRSSACMPSVFLIRIRSIGTAPWTFSTSTSKRPCSWTATTWCIYRLCLSGCGCRGRVWLVCRGNGTHCPQGRAGGRDAGGRAFYQVHHPHLQ